MHKNYSSGRRHKKNDALCFSACLAQSGRPFITRAGRIREVCIELNCDVKISVAAAAPELRQSDSTAGGRVILNSSS
jgi:hypothetical protein